MGWGGLYNDNRASLSSTWVALKLPTGTELGNKYPILGVFKRSIGTYIIFKYLIIFHSLCNRIEVLYQSHHILNWYPGYVMIYWIKDIIYVIGGISNKKQEQAGAKLCQAQASWSYQPTCVNKLWTSPEQVISHKKFINK